VTALSVEDVIASAVATPVTAVPAGDEPAVPGGGARERMQTLAEAVRLGVHDWMLTDRRCGRRFTVGAFVRHCADVEHTVREVDVDEPEVNERELGRQGESRTAVAGW